MPLVWAHAEFLKLLIARERGRPVEWLDRIEQHFGHRPIAHPSDRLREAAAPRAHTGLWHWREEVPIERLPAGKALAVEDRKPFTLHLGFDGWQRAGDRRAERARFGLWSVTLTSAELAQTQVLNFTRRRAGGWENFDHRIEIERSAAVATPTLQDSRRRNAA